MIENYRCVLLLMMPREGSVARFAASLACFQRRVLLCASPFRPATSTTHQVPQSLHHITSHRISSQSQSAPSAAPIAAAKPAAKKEGLAKAEYDYTAESKDDLEFHFGDEIVLVERVNADWLRGTLRGKTGLFPAAFVTIIRDV